MIITANKLLNYIIILFLILTSGAVISQANNSIFLIILLILVLIKAIKDLKRIAISSLVVFLILVAILLFTFLQNQDYEYLDSYFALVILLLVALLVSSLINIREFGRIYFNLMFLLAILSVPFYLIGIFNPLVVANFPILVKGEGLEYANAFVHVFPLPIWEDTLRRNNGIFWEPGAYQAFLNLGIFFYLSKIVPQSRINVYKLIFLILIVITTGSTTGYLLLMLLLLIYLFNKRRTIWNLLLPVTFISIFTFSDLFEKYVLDKFNSSQASYSSFVRRNSDWKTDLEVSANNLFFGEGFGGYYESFSQLIDSNLGGITTSSSNSLTSSIAIIGLLFVLVLLIFQYKFCLNIGTNHISAMIYTFFFLIIFFSQPLLLRPLWLVIVYYGINKYKSGDSREDSYYI